jgi:cyclohexa-1,5-dienecarbonyl-CoA hydratase
MPDSVRQVASHDGAWLHLLFHHPKGNILTFEMMTALREALRGAARQHALKLVSLEGAGGNFSFGASIEEHVPAEIRRVLPETHRLILDLLALPVATAAIVRGRCFGGGFELALACDFVFAAEDAVFGLPEISLGVFPPAGAALLPLRVGQSRSARAIITGQSRPAADWLQAGLLDFLAPAAKLEGEVERWFEAHLLPLSASSLSHAVTATRLGLREQVGGLLPQLERLYLDWLMSTDDAAEGVAAFLEKRRPQWQNR